MNHTMTFLAVALLVSCGSDSATGPGGSSDSSMTAQIDGESFTAVTVEVGDQEGGTLSVLGTTSTAASTVRQISFHIEGVTGPGTYTVSPSTITNIALVTITTAGAPSQWGTNVEGGGGTVTITSLTGDGATGTFAFTGSAHAGTAATGLKSVTNGAFDLRF